MFDITSTVINGLKVTLLVQLQTLLWSHRSSPIWLLINDHGIQFAHFDNELMVNVFTMGNTCSTSHGLSNNKSYFNEESNCTAANKSIINAIMRIFHLFWNTFDWRRKIRVERVMFLQFETLALPREGGMLFQRHRKECGKDYTQISWCLMLCCYRVSNGASFSLVKQKNFWYCFSRECSDHDP